jgi:hypothetical protein
MILMGYSWGFDETKDRIAVITGALRYRPRSAWTRGARPDAAGRTGRRGHGAETGNPGRTLGDT